MSSYSQYSSHHKKTPDTGRRQLQFDDHLSYSNGNSRDNSCSASPTSPSHPSSSSAHSSLSQIHTLDYNSNRTTATDATLAPPSAESPTSTLNSSHSPKRGASPTMAFSNTSLPSLTRWKRFRLKVMRMATVERLQLLWGLLALFGTMSWLALLPAHVFRTKFDATHFKVSVYAFFLVATVCTSLSAIWQSLCPFLVRQSQRAFLPRVINHPATQTATICISVILTILNFFSWIVLASDTDAGAKTNCQTGPLSNQPGYVAQCRGVNVAIVLDVIVFILWIPISLVIVCGTVERGLWWWGEDDGWAQGEAIVGGSNMMSEEEFDLKIGLGGSKHIKRRQTVHPDNLTQQEQRLQDMVMIQQPKPAFVTPIASQFRSSTFGLEGGADGNDDDDLNFTPSSYRRHHQQRRQPRQLTRQASNTSLSSRLSSFFGAGWNNGTMPLPEAQPPMPDLPPQYRMENAALSRNNDIKKGPSQPQQQQQKQQSMRKKEEPKQEAEPESEPAGLLHGDEYTSQWHSRRYDDWS